MRDGLVAESESFALGSLRVEVLEVPVAVPRAELRGVRVLTGHRAMRMNTARMNRPRRCARSSDDPPRPPELESIH